MRLSYLGDSIWAMPAGDANVGRDEVWTMGIGKSAGLVLCRGDIERSCALKFEEVADYVGYQWLVFDNQNVTHGGHLYRAENLRSVTNQFRLLRFK